MLRINKDIETNETYFKFKLVIFSVVIWGGVMQPCLVIAQEDSGFFEKNFAEGMFEGNEDSNPSFGTSTKNGQNARKMREFQDQYKEQVEAAKAQREALIAEMSQQSSRTVPKLKNSASPREMHQQQKASSKYVAAEAARSADAEVNGIKSSDAPFEPIDIAEHNEVVIDMIIGAKPADHLFREIRRAGEVSRIKGVKIGEVYVVGQPPLSNEFFEALKDFKAGEGKVSFVMEPPNGKKFDYSPVWTVTVDGKPSIFEGNFSIHEIFVVK
jgi:hypothetical protein